MSAALVQRGALDGRTQQAGAFDVSLIEFDGGERYGWHSAPRASLGVILRGTIRKNFGRQSFDAAEGTVVLVPAEELHSDVVGKQPAALVLVESDAGFESVTTFRDWGAMVLGLKVERELIEPDDYSALALEGLALELSAAARRSTAARRPAPWLKEAYDFLHDRFRKPPAAAEIAAAVGVPPASLVREFREHYRETPADCARRLRLDWAACRLVGSDAPLAMLSIEAGFVDQSHFTRAFKRQYGTTPARYRSAHR
jgi:AraC-like DNA-binding protein/quercetin dioxygenase-like cupin family protein